MKKLDKQAKNMKTIKNLTIKVTYTVGLGEVEVEDEEYESLMKAYNEFAGEVPSPDECCCFNGNIVLYWLSVRLVG